MKAIMVALLACVMVPALALAQEGQAPGNLNTITGVNVTGGRVEIVGTKKPNFTTFTMTDPPRLVIDISEAVFSGVKEEIAVGNGTVTGIRTASYGSDESSIARVLIGYEREVETDIQASGNTLVVTIAGSGGAAVAERPATQGTAPAGTAPATAATTPGTTAEQAAVAAQTDRQQQEKAAAQATTAAQTDRQQQEKAVAQATAAAQAERQQQEKAAAQASAAASPQAEAEAQRQAQARAEADRKAQEDAARVAAQQAKQSEQRRLQEERAAKEAAAAAEKQRQQDEARAAAEEKKRQQADEKARREAEAQAAAAEKKRQQDEARAALEEKKRQQAEEREAKREEAQAAAEERRRQQAEARQARVAQAETPRQAPAQGDSAAGSSRSTVMTLVGFQPTGSRVFVRTNEPVRFNVTEGNKEVVLELENTRIAESNNTRSLNTSFFDTAVASVNANVGPSRTVRIAIKLKEQVSYETRQEGNEVFIEFQSPSRR